VHAATDELATVMLTPEPEAPVLPEPTKVTIFCPECNEVVAIVDVHAFILGLHQRVCVELTAVNGAPD
jgi:hypothetical protein